MKKYIIISFQKEFIVFSSSNDVPSLEDVINSNKMFHNQFIYTKKYFKNNYKTSVYSGIKDVIKEKSIVKSYTEEEKLVLPLLEFIKMFKINSLFVKNFKSLKSDECNLIISNKYLAYINCYYIPYAYEAKMKEQKRKIHLNYQEAITDEFMIHQDVIDSDAIYYKKVLHFKPKYEYKEKDFINFLNLNVYLKTIHLHYYKKEMLESIIKCLKKDNRDNIVILLYQENNDFIEKDFKYLKEVNKEYHKELHGDIRIIYSSNFVKNNLFKQLTYNNIKMSSVIVLYVILIALIFTELYNYVAKLNIEKLNYQLYSEINNGSSFSSSVEVSSVQIEEEPSKYSFEKSFITLKKINSDTVGWINVKGTDIDYPVVKYTNNDYYLKRDFYKSWTSQGWIFMDYRNSEDALNLDDNTIIYGHKLKNGLMFGTLSNALKKSWYTNEDNLIITFDTPSTNMKWKVFSVYRTEYTTDYLSTTFTNAEAFNKFVTMLSARSIYNFKEKLEYGDKILTLSTCIGASSSNQRLVVHAKLIK